jgi:hypothetical protein
MHIPIWAAHLVELVQAHVVGEKQKREDIRLLVHPRHIRRQKRCQKRSTISKVVATMHHYGGTATPFTVRNFSEAQRILLMRRNRAEEKVRFYCCVKRVGRLTGKGKNSIVWAWWRCWPPSRSSVRQCPFGSIITDEMRRQNPLSPISPPAKFLRILSPWDSSLSIHTRKLACV